MRSSTCGRLGHRPCQHVTKKEHVQADFLHLQAVSRRRQPRLRSPASQPAGARASLRGTCGLGAGRRRPKRLVSIGVYLEVTLVNGQNYSIPVEEGHSLEQELDLFLKREGRYATEWVPLMKAGRELFVRYEQIVLISPMG
jgi:hypothetical protein